MIETEYEVGQDNVEVSVGPFGLDIHNPVFADLRIDPSSPSSSSRLRFRIRPAAFFGDLRDWLTTHASTGSS
jgi:BCCT family betaine/carnitine transporter